MVNVNKGMMFKSIIALVFLTLYTFGDTVTYQRRFSHGTEHREGGLPPARYIDVDVNWEENTRRIHLDGDSNIRFSDIVGREVPFPNNPVKEVLTNYSSSRTAERSFFHFNRPEKKTTVFELLEVEDLLITTHGSGYGPSYVPPVQFKVLNILKPNKKVVVSAGRKSSKFFEDLAAPIERGVFADVKAENYTLPVAVESIDRFIVVKIPSKFLRGIWANSVHLGSGVYGISIKHGGKVYGAKIESDKIVGLVDTREITAGVDVHDSGLVVGRGFETSDSVYNTVRGVSENYFSFGAILDSTGLVEIEFWFESPRSADGKIKLETKKYGSLKHTARSHSGAAELINRIDSVISQTPLNSNIERKLLTTKAFVPIWRYLEDYISGNRIVNSAVANPIINAANQIVFKEQERLDLFSDADGSVFSDRSLLARAKSLRTQLDRVLPILPVRIAVDSNRNGNVEFGVDRTSEKEPYVFWVNNDYDKGDGDTADEIDPNSKEHPSLGDNTDSNKLPNYQTPTIDGFRDLEDFARLQLQINNNPVVLSALKNGFLRARLQFKDGTISGDPRMNVFLHLDEDGGRGYVEDEDSALKHAGINANLASDPSKRTGGLRSMGLITKATSLVFPTSFWNGQIKGGKETEESVYPEISVGDPVRRLLFEGAGAGKGELELVFTELNNTVGFAGSCWIELKDVKNMYEHYYCGALDGLDYEDVNQLEPNRGDQEVGLAEPLYKLPFRSSVFPFEYGNPIKDEEKDYILFVHGWRMKPHEKLAFTETAFKRLWHRGYRGRFGMFAWPTEWTSRPAGTAVWDVDNYNRSDRKAMLSAEALRVLLLRLNGKYPGRLRVFAHSMGNVVVSEAMKLEAEGAGRNMLHTYVACQAASVARAYDSNEGIERLNREFIDSKTESFFGVFALAKNVALLPETRNDEETYADYPLTRKPLYNEINKVAGNIVNFHNRKDDALAWWLVGQYKKASFGWGYGSIPVGGQYTDKKDWYRGSIIEIPQPGSVHGVPSPTSIETRGDMIPTFSGRALKWEDDTYEIHAHIAEADSPPLGAAEEGNSQLVGNVIGNRFNLNTSLSSNQVFESEEEDHSAQFRSTNMRRWEFWDEILSNRDHFDIKTDY